MKYQWSSNLFVCGGFAQNGGCRGRIVGTLRDFVILHTWFVLLLLDIEEMGNSWHPLARNSAELYHISVSS